MSDTLQALGGFALIVGLFVAYALERRAKNRPKALPAAPTASPVEAAPAAEPSGGRSSINWGAPIIYCLLLWGVAHPDTNWRFLWLALYAAMIALGAYTMFSPKELAIERRRQPDLSRREHYVTIGVPYLVFPVAGLTLVLMGVRGAILVPALPWVFIILAAAVLLPLQAIAGGVKRLVKR